MIETALCFARGIDEHDWEKVRQTLSGTIVLDGSAMGRPSRELAAPDFLSYMQSASGSFQSTCHYAGNFQQRQQTGRQGTICFDLMALHYLPQSSGEDAWCLFRKMKLSMWLQDNGRWEITGVQTLFEQTAGNLQLMEQVGKGRPERLPQVPGRNIDLIAEYFSSAPATDSWTFRNTHDPDITLVAYAHDAAVSVSAAIFYYKDGLLQREVTFSF